MSWCQECSQDVPPLCGPCAEFPALAEECRSLSESCAYFIRLGECSEAIRCECCGIFVVQVPEALASDGPSRAYRPGIWESGTTGPYRKHTLRRCNWWRALQEASGVMSG